MAVAAEDRGLTISPGRRQIRTFTPSAAMHKYTVWPTGRRVVTATVSQATTRRALDNRARTRRSVLEQALRHGPLEARRTAFSVASAIFWRMRGEAQQPRTVAPGHDKNDSVLRGRPADLEAVRTATSMTTTHTGRPVTGDRKPMSGLARKPTRGYDHRVWAHLSAHGRSHPAPKIRHHHKVGEPMREQVGWWEPSTGWPD